MKGIIFDTFRDMLEKEVGILETQEIIEQSDLPSRGAYTSTGNYSHTELLSLLETLSERSHKPALTWLNLFAEYLFHRFNQLHPDLVAGCTELGALLNSINSFIHPEVSKLYPEAELPVFTTLHKEEGRIILLYESPRNMHVFAVALIHAAGKHYNLLPRVEVRPLDEGKSPVVLDITWK